MKINYGVVKREGEKILSKCGKIDLPKVTRKNWDSDETHKLIRSKIREAMPGWNLQGYCPARRWREIG